MKRRGFIRTLAVAPAVPALVAQQPAAPARAGRAATPPRAPGSEVPRIPTAEASDVAEGNRRFLSTAQFAALRHLAGVLLPPVKGEIGALDCDASEFIDFLLANSPAERQQLYRTGLDGLNAQARKQFSKSFAELDAKQADAIIRPLLTTVPWVYDLPKDPMKRFLYQAHTDIRTATRNSPEAAAALANSGRRGTAGGGLYWNPIDPV